jgi:hypothetical protein
MIEPLKMEIALSYLRAPKIEWRCRFALRGGRPLHQQLFPQRFFSERAMGESVLLIISAEKNSYTLQPISASGITQVSSVG